MCWPSLTRNFIGSSLVTDRGDGQAGDAAVGDLHAPVCIIETALIERTNFILRASRNRDRLVVRRVSREAETAGVRRVERDGDRRTAAILGPEHRASVVRE